MAKAPGSLEPVRLPRHTWPSFESWSLVAFSLGTGTIVFLTVLNLMSDSGWLSLFKAGIFAALAALVSYGVNRFAIQKGARLAASGFVSAGLASVGSILAVGLGLFPSSYAGLVINEVDELRLQEHARALSGYVFQRHKIAGQAARLIPVLEANKGELVRAKTCEESDSCISRRGAGGRGTVTKFLEDKVGRAETIATSLANGNADRQARLDELNTLLADFQDTLNKSELSLKERRQKLAEVDGKIHQAIAALEEALPVSLLHAYAAELKAGVKIPGRPVATTNLNQLFSKHARSLELVLGTLTNAGQQPPKFPARSGVSETFAYIGHFLPIAALTACVELVFPLTMWVYALLAISWDKFLREAVPAPRKPGRPPVTSPETSAKSGRQA